MTFADYLADLRKRNPNMPLTGKMTMEIEAFETQLRRAFEAGAKSKSSKLNPFPWLGGLG